MVSDHRNLIFILCLCVTLFGIFAGVKIRDQSQIGAWSPELIDTTVPQEIETQDPTFLDSNSPGIVPTSGTLIPTGIPGVTASAYLVGNIKIGKIYLEKNATRVLPVASMSKLVTAFVATDLFTATTTVTITDDALRAPPDGSNLQVGEKYELQEILEPLLLNSSNVAAESIASTSDRVAFMAMMRSYAWEVGMPHSYFADPSGVSSRNVASAEDLFGLAKYLVDYRPDILALTRTASSSFATTTEHGSHMINSTHPFVQNPSFVGGKTGRTTAAGETMLTIMNINDQLIAFIILGAQIGSRESDTKILIEKIGQMGEL